MNLANLFSGNEDKKIRYGIVALGSISQEAMMPGVDHTGNSKVAALVTSDPVKAETLSKKYDAESFTYEEFPQLLDSRKIDALYIATPNWRHAEFAVPALQKGIHVLLEKPMEISSERCQQMIAAQEQSNAKLMIAYRLHFEPATISTIETVRSGKLGEVHLFTSTFCQLVETDNHRVLNGVLAGVLYDMGPYPINGARNLFEDEPVEAFATTSRHPASGFPADVQDTIAVSLRFPNNRLAQFTVSYYGNAINEFNIVGSKGSIRMNPAYVYGKPLEYDLQIEDAKSHESFKNTDHFGGELKYFSNCILNDVEPEPDGYEGLADVRVIEAILRSIESGRFESVEAVTIRRRISRDQTEELRVRATPEMVHASAPARGIAKNPKN